MRKRIRKLSETACFVLLSSILLACSSPQVPPADRPACKADSDCPTGQSCSAETCIVEGTAADFGEPDTAETDTPDVAPPACMEFTTDAVTFEATDLGTMNGAVATLRNCSETEPRTIEKIEICTLVGDGQCLSNRAFSLSDSTAADSALQLAPGEELSLELTFTPTRAGAFTGRLSVYAFDTAAFIDLRGEGRDTTCPVAAATADSLVTGEIGEEIHTLEQHTVTLSGVSSFDEHSAISRYEWTLTSRPSGSTAAVMPSTSGSQATLFLDLPGDYVVELNAWDSSDVPSCTPASVTIHADPTVDIRIELRWDTPGDDDQTDTNGNDVDLHFLHPNGTWNNIPHDIFWNNPTNEWGMPGPDDDPELTLDDTDGAGPEIIALDQPEMGLTYAVGAYYYSDGGFGETFASIDIYLRGILTAQYGPTYLPARGYFWYTATISWPTGDIFEVKQVRNGFPNRP